MAASLVAPRLADTRQQQPVLQPQGQSHSQPHMA